MGVLVRIPEKSYTSVHTPSSATERVGAEPTRTDDETWIIDVLEEVAYRLVRLFTESVE